MSDLQIVNMIIIQISADKTGTSDITVLLLAKYSEMLEQKNIITKDIIILNNLEDL